ncbi:MAG: UDP-N-acetylmuramoyl-tripeptide--D-alanyl-D-alanine ligase [Acidimicrobiia bacterium]
MRFTGSEIAAAVGGRRHGPDVEVAGASIDSRTVRPGQLFVPVVADRDGHDYIGAALAAGAVAYLTARPPHGDGTAVEVADTAQALLDLGRHARRTHPVTVIGVTGSVGKTTVKDLVSAALGSWVPHAASEKSFNNELGVPLTLVNAADTAAVVVVEMGARGPGHIALLCDVARPDIGVVTAVAPVHTETFGTVEEVARAKGELVASLPSSGVAVLNHDQPLVASMASRATARVLTFGLKIGADVRAEGVRLGPDMHPAFRARTPWGAADVTVAAAGAHQVGNALAALAAACAAGADLERAVEGLAAARLSPWRMEIVAARSGATVINDAYNANPASMEAALRALAGLPVSGRRIAVLGVMAELGERSAAEHRRMADLAASLGIDPIAVDAPAYGVREVTGVAGALAALAGLGPTDAVLVKGSRVAGLERLAAALA